MIIFKTKKPAVKGRSCEGIAENKSENIENDAPSFQKHFNFACSARGGTTPGGRRQIMLRTVAKP